MIVVASSSYNENYMETVVHEAAITAMNFGINEVWANGTTSDTMLIYSTECSSKVEIYSASTDSILVKATGWGYVFDEEYYEQFGTQKKLTDSLFAYFTYATPASKYFWFTNNEAGVYWTTGDTVWGPVHCNHILKTNGYPVFYGKVTALSGISPNPEKPGSKASFYGGWEVGVDQGVPTDMTYLVNLAVTSNGAAPMNSLCMYDQETTFEFLSNGNVIRTVGSNPADTVALSTIAPDNVIYCSQNVHVKGVMNGQVTIYTDNDIWIDDDIVYADDPIANPDSDDLLGLVAYNDIIVGDNMYTAGSVNIQGCLFAATGGFAAENAGTKPVSGTINLVGSISQNTRGSVGNWSHSVKHGYNKNYYYDDRLRYIAPPNFPTIGALRLVTWWE